MIHAFLEAYEGERRSTAGRRMGRERRCAEPTHRESLAPWLTFGGGQHEGMDDMKRLPAAAGMAVLSAALACGGGHGDEVLRSTAQNIGAAGGIVSMSEGPTITIPPGALAADTTVTVSQMSAAAPSGAISPLFRFGPDGTTFGSPVAIAFPVPDGTTVAAIYWTKPGSATDYETVPATVEGTIATAYVTHFSSGYVGPLYLAGVATGVGTFTLTVDGTSVPGSRSVTHFLSQVGSTITDHFANSDGATGTCVGPIAGDTISLSCSGVVDGCPFSGHLTSVVDPVSLSSSYGYEFTASGDCGGAVEVGEGTAGPPAPLDLSGTWAVTDTNMSNTCGVTQEELSFSYTDTNVQAEDGKSVSITEGLNDRTYTYTLSGNTLSYSGRYYRPTCTIDASVALSLSSPTFASGAATWTCSYTGGSCSGTNSITVFKQ